MQQGIARTVCLGLISVCLAGCHRSSECNLCAPSAIPPATSIEYPDVHAPCREDLESVPPPWSLHNREIRDYRDLTLAEAIQTSLQNSKVFRDLGGRVLAAPGQIPSVYDPAIQESDPRFGVEAALSAFDAQWTTNLFWERNDRVLNQQNPFLFQQELATFNSELSKTAATGTRFFARNNTNYDGNNSPFNRFPSVWETDFEAEFVHPLLQGGGIEFNRIAGPNASPGFFFSNGVMIARINTDISLADFEAGVRQLVSDVENAYWDLYYAYRELDARRLGQEAALKVWRATMARREAKADEAQAREQFFLFKSLVEDSLSGRPGGSTQTGTTNSGLFRASGGVFAREQNLRLILGLPPTGDRLIRPVDKPSQAAIRFDWNRLVSEAVVRRVELRRQRWQIKRREMELIAAQNFLLPRLDVQGRYRWRGLGDDLIDAERDAGSTSTAFQNLTGGRHQEWRVGLQFAVPLGFRQGHAAVRNAELNLSRERAVLREQELQIVHDLSDSVRELHRAYQLMQTNLNRRIAAQQQVESVEVAYEIGNLTINVLLDAQRRLVEAELAYFASLVEYNLAIKNLQFTKGTLLDYNGIQLSEGPWPARAYCDAAERARRFAPRKINYGCVLPCPVEGAGPEHQLQVSSVTPVHEQAAPPKVIIRGVRPAEPLPPPAGFERLPPP